MLDGGEMQWAIRLAAAHVVAEDRKPKPGASA
jgi:hypothetical protein